MSSEQPNAPRPVRRTTGIWLLAMAFALCGVIGAIRGVEMWNNGAAYQSLGMQVSPVLLGLYGVVWALGGFGGMVVLFFRHPLSMKIAWGCAGFLSFSYWLDRFLLTVNPGRQVNAGFAVVLNILLLGWMTWLFYRKKGRRYFRVDEEKEGFF